MKKVLANLLSIKQIESFYDKNILKVWIWIMIFFIFVTYKSTKNVKNQWYVFKFWNFIPLLWILK